MFLLDEWLLFGLFAGVEEVMNEVENWILVGCTELLELAIE